jgi:BirA family biotin operon repressor/biotin-[acetyl-CoA-carboxylase] ligase
MKDWEIIQLESCNSTNEYAKKLMSSDKTTDKTAIVTDFQEKGRGQSNNRWHSEKGKNLLCSLIYKTEIKAEKHFLLNIATSLTIIDTLKSLGIKAKIKWPNDIYINKDKAAGILIENSLVQDLISSSTIGIGLNVNQKKFPAWIPNPVSLSMIGNTQFEIQNILTLLIENFEKQIANIKKLAGSAVFNWYLDNMYQYKTWAVYQTNQHQFNGRILGVQPTGHLIVETDGGQILNFDFGDIRYC